MNQQHVTLLLLMYHAYESVRSLAYTALKIGIPRVVLKMLVVLADPQKRPRREEVHS